MPTAKSSKLKVPALLFHKATGQGYVRLGDRFHYLGRYDDPETQQRYRRLLAEWAASKGCQVSALPEEVTIKELITRYLVHVEQYYCRPDGSPTSEVLTMSSALRALGDLYANTNAAEFGPRALIAVRHYMIGRGWCRNHINQQISRVRSMFRWATEHELIPGNIYHALTAVAGLKKGRSEAPERERVAPVSMKLVNAVEPFVSRQVWAMIRLQCLTAARPGELTKLRKQDIDRSGNVWVHVPDEHKTAHHGHQRVIYFGPKAQEVLTPFLLRADDAPLFSPAEAERARLKKKHAARETPLHLGNRPGTNRTDDPKVAPGETYDVASYRRAIARACDQAFPLPEPLARRDDETKRQWFSRLTTEQKAEIKRWRKSHRWHPHRLRHTAATDLRKEFGLEVARVVLGHHSLAVTEIYAEFDKAKALDAMLKAG